MLRFLNTVREVRLAAYEWNFSVLRGGSDGDADNDDLSNSEEISTYSTDPLVADTDGDGSIDGLEIADKTDPRDAGSRTRMIYLARPLIELSLPTADEIAGTGIFLARPPAEVSLPARDEVGGTGTVVAMPSVEVALPDRDETQGRARGTTEAKPPVSMKFTE